ncbi:TraR/DksA family transcriptional regulator [Streptomyces yerevanensis]|uniref:TraR/DksA family transcriptional regulator n=1 Tax=Streptomyces yerevanensis TaxID=66378 RepID=UPI000525030A|nr:TraR/DksA C4-type zinc finger protein [Streptomyces yerevanensis]
MVAKKTAVPQSASGRTTGAAGGAGAAAKDVSGTKSTRGAVKTAKPVKTVRGGSGTGVRADARAGGAVGGGKPEGTKTAASKTASTKSAATKRAGEKTAAKKETASKAATKKRVTKKRAGKKEVAEKGAVNEGGVMKSAESAVTAGAPAKRPSKSAVRKSTRTARKAVASATEGAAEAAKTTGATTVVAKKTPGTATAAGKATAVPKARLSAAEPGELAVRPGEDPWTPEEVAEARAELLAEVVRLRAEITNSEESLAGLMRDSGDGAGDDQADTGTKNITREHEMALAANAREMLEQTERALERLDAGTYGLCESCGNPIGKARMQAFPRATLCVECKQKTERRH